MKFLQLMTCSFKAICYCHFKCICLMLHSTKFWTPLQISYNQGSELWMSVLEEQKCPLYYKDKKGLWKGRKQERTKLKLPYLRRLTSVTQLENWSLQAAWIAREERASLTSILSSIDRLSCSFQLLCSCTLLQYGVIIIEVP